MEGIGEPAIAGAQAIRRSVAILRCVAALRQEQANLPAIVQVTGLNRSTAFRLLQCLVEERMLAFDPVARTYRIGRLAIELGLAGTNLDCVAAPWRERIARLSRETGLTAYLVVRSGGEVVCLESVQAETALRAVPLVPGQRLPLGVGAGSLAILASLSDREIELILERNRNQLGTLPSRRLGHAEIWRRIEATRRAGHAYSAQTVARGIVGLGMVLPSRDDGLVELAASVSKVGEALPEDEQARLAAIMRRVLLAPPDAVADVAA